MDKITEAERGKNKDEKQKKKFLQYRKLEETGFYYNDKLSLKTYCLIIV